MPQIASNERVAAFGKTRSGKTWLMRDLSKNLNRFWLLDSKGTLTNWNTQDANERALDKFAAGEKMRLRFVPPLEGIADFWAGVFDTALQIGNLTLYVDEMYDVVEPGTKSPDKLRACWTRGAEFGIGAWSASQRPVFIPQFVISESEHIFVFRLPKFEDRQKIQSNWQGGDLPNVKDRHGFFYYHVESDAPIYYSQLGAPGVAMTPKEI